MRARGLAVRLNDRLARGREAALARMESRVRILRDSGTTATDPSTGRQVRVWTVVATDIPARLATTARVGMGASRDTTSGGTRVQLALRTVHLPWHLEGIQDDDLMDFTSGEWAGTVWRTVEVEQADQKTSRRVPVIQARRPSGEVGW